MRRRLSAPWTVQDDERLRALVAQGASPVRAAAALRRSKEYIRDRANKLGCPFPHAKVARQNGPIHLITNGEKTVSRQPIPTTSNTVNNHRLLFGCHFLRII
jgi:hypothetical protein